MVRRTLRIAVTGAAGQIAYALLFRIASGSMFGPDTDIELSLLELEPAMGALKGVVMELDDCAFPLLKKVYVSIDARVAFTDVDWAILVGAAPRKAGMERGDLLKINAGVFVEQGQALARSAKRSCRVLVVGNPCNTNAWIVKETARGLDSRNIFAMTMLDQNRSVAQIAQKAGVSAGEVTRVGIWGNHSATQFPDFFNAQIGGQKATDVIRDEQWFKNEFIGIVQRRGAEVIKARGLSSAASAANAIVDSVRAIAFPTRPGSFDSVAVVSDGSYGVPQGLVFGYPIISDGNEWFVVKGIKHNDFSLGQIKVTLDELIQERDQVCDLVAGK